MLERVVDIGRALGAQRGEWVRDTDGGGVHPVWQLSEDLLYDRLEQRPLVGEVNVDRHGADPNGIGDGTRGDLRWIVGRGQERLGRRQDLGAKLMTRPGTRLGPPRPGCWGGWVHA